VLIWLGIVPFIVFASIAWSVGIPDCLYAAIAFIVSGIVISIGMVLCERRSRAPEETSGDPAPASVPMATGSRPAPEENIPVAEVVEDRSKSDPYALAQA
jgi:hypothetical protein